MQEPPRVYIDHAPTQVLLDGLGMDGVSRTEPGHGIDVCHSSMGFDGVVGCVLCYYCRHAVV